MDGVKGVSLVEDTPTVWPRRDTTIPSAHRRRLLANSLPDP